MRKPVPIPPWPPRRPDSALLPKPVDQYSSVRWNRGAGVFDDGKLHRWMVWLDEAFRVPGTPFRFGVDGIIGLVPGAGDVVAGLLSLVIPIAAWTRGVPYVTLVRMAVNIGISTALGAVPFVGDVFLVVWKANRRNYNLLRLHVNAPRRHTGADWAFLTVLVLAILLVLALPLVLLAALLFWIARGI